MPASTNSRAASTRSKRTPKETSETANGNKINQERTMKNNNEVQLATMPKDSSSPVPLPGNRPIEASNLNVHDTLSAMGQRPITSSNIEVTNTFSVSGNRPIASSHLHIDQTFSSMGSRPVASNDLDEADLMGYLD